MDEGKRTMTRLILLILVAYVLLPRRERPRARCCWDHFARPQIPSLN